MSVTDCYEVEEISGDSVWLRCRRCGHTWKLFDGKSWRCPLETDHEPPSADRNAEVLGLAEPDALGR